MMDLPICNHRTCPFVHGYVDHLASQVSGDQGLKCRVFVPLFVYAAGLVSFKPLAT